MNIHINKYNLLQQKITDSALTSKSPYQFYMA